MKGFEEGRPIQRPLLSLILLLFSHLIFFETDGDLEGVNDELQSFSSLISRVSENNFHPILTATLFLYYFGWISRRKLWHVCHISESNILDSFSVLLRLELFLRRNNILYILFSLCFEEIPEILEYSSTDLTEILNEIRWKNYASYYHLYFI